MSVAVKHRIAILGAGESGTGSAVLAHKQGFEVFVSDKGAIKEKYTAELNSIGVQWEQQQHTESLILNADEIIKSPGIPDNADLIVAAKAKGIPVISEIEFAGRYSTASHIGITGTNGKTTTTMLTYHILQKAGLNVGLGGNIGNSFARQVAENKHDYYVLELSSFQLDDTYTFHPHIAILCNITPDHMDRYQYEFQNYIDSKFRIGNNQTATDYFIYCQDDAAIMKNIDNYGHKAKRLPFSYGSEVTEGAYVKDGVFHLVTNLNSDNNFTMFIHDFALKGIHNSYNSMAAAIAANALNIRKEVIRESLIDFQNVEHRLEFVATIGGVDYINDSKATNVNSAWYALESMDTPTIWIAGGVDKGNDYEALIPLVKEKVKVIVCLGVDNSKIHAAFGKHVDLIVNTMSAAEAVHVSSKFAQKGDTVLLSPACASFDLFANYEDRGWQFKAAVKNL